MARSFGGTSSDEIKNTTTDSITAPVSFSAWVFITTVTPDWSSVMAGVSTGAGYDFQITKTNANVALVKNGIVEIGHSTGAVTLSAWQQVGFTFDGTNWAAYLAGAASGSGSNAQTVTTPTGGYTIGYNSSFGGGPAQFWNGKLADVAMWTAILTAGEMSALGNGARPNTIRPGSLFRYWPLTGIQSPEPDLSRNAANGTVTGTVNASGPPVMQFTPRWPLNSPFNTVTSSSTGTSFQPAWVMNQRIVVDGIGI